MLNANIYTVHVILYAKSLTIWNRVCKLLNASFGHTIDSANVSIKLNKSLNKAFWEYCQFMGLKLQYRLNSYVHKSMEEKLYKFSCGHN